MLFVLSQIIPDVAFEPDEAPPDWDNVVGSRFLLVGNQDEATLILAPRIISGRSGSVHVVKSTVRRITL